jgi:hypothetical protein
LLQEYDDLIGRLASRGVLGSSEVGQPVAWWWWWVVVHRESGRVGARKRARVVVRWWRWQKMAAATAVPRKRRREGRGEGAGSQSAPGKGKLVWDWVSLLS